MHVEKVVSTDVIWSKPSEVNFVPSVQQTSYHEVREYRPVYRIWLKILSEERESMIKNTISHFFTKKYLFL